MPQIKTLSPLCTPPEKDITRLGIIALATDMTMERDAARLIAYDEAAVHVARIPFENPTRPDSLRAMAPRLTTAAGLLVPGVDLAAIAFACTSASVTIRNEVVTSAIGQVRPNVPVVTPSSSALCAFKALNVQRIALLTPYVVETTAPMMEYFEAQGITVENAACFDMEDDREMARLDHQTMIDAAVSMDNDSIEAIFMSCTSLPAVEVIDAIEARLGKPVVSSNQATLWALRGVAGLPPPKHGVGKLFGMPFYREAMAS